MLPDRVNCSKIYSSCQGLECWFVAHYWRRHVWTIVASKSERFRKEGRTCLGPLLKTDDLTRAFEGLTANHSFQSQNKFSIFHGRRFVSCFCTCARWETLCWAQYFISLQCCTWRVECLFVEKLFLQSGCIWFSVPKRGTLANEHRTNGGLLVERYFCSRKTDNQASADFR